MEKEETLKPGRTGNSQVPNWQTDREIQNRVALYKNRDKNEIDWRINQLEKEWSLERMIATFAASLALSGTLMAAFFNRRWLILPGLMSAFLLQHGIQGWCPLLPLFRAFKVRARKEIDWEKFSLKQLRGDFDRLTKTSSRGILEAVRKN